LEIILNTDRAIATKCQLRKLEVNLPTSPLKAQAKAHQKLEQKVQTVTKGLERARKAVGRKKGAQRRLLPVPRW